MASSTTQPHPVHPPADNTPKRKIELTSAQIGASAGAAVTSAVGASFFGATGTITGAALGSVISTVASALYARSLQNAQEKLRETTVMVRRTSVGPRSAGPASVPGTQQLDEVGAGTRRQAADGTPSGSETVVVETAAEPPTTALSTPGTQALPAAEPGAPEPGAPEPGAPQGPGEPDAPAADEAPRPSWTRRRLLTTAGVAVAGFAIAIGGVSAVEAIKGGPISGGDGGTSFSRVVTGDTAPATQQDEEPATDPEPTSTPEPTQSSSPEPTESAGTDPTPTAEPSESVTTEPSETTTSEPEPTAEPTQGAGTEGSGGTGAQPAPTEPPAVD